MTLTKKAWSSLMSFASSQHVKQKASRSSMVPVIYVTGSPKSGSEVNKVRGEFNPQILVCSKARADFISGIICSLRRINVSLNLFRSSYTKYLILLILGVAPFASTQDSKLPPDVKISEASKLDKSQAGYYRMKIGKIDVTALTDGDISVDFVLLLANTKPGEVESLLAREYVKPTSVEASMNAYLIELDNKLILVDAGAGELLGPKLDKLPDSLRSIGIQPEQITDIRICMHDLPCNSRLLRD